MITIEALDDDVVDPGEYVLVELAMWRTWGPRASLAEPHSAVINIIDDDAPYISFTSDTLVTRGGPNVAKLIVTRGRGSTAAASVEYMTDSGTARAGVDFAPVSGVLSWAAGDDTPKVIEVPILRASGASVQADAAEPKRFSVLLMNAAGAQLDAPAAAVVTILPSQFSDIPTLWPLALLVLTALLAFVALRRL